MFGCERGAIAEMQARRRARTSPPVALDEFAELNRDELVAMAKARGINAAQNRRAVIEALYRSIHELDKLQGTEDCNLSKPTAS